MQIKKWIATGMSGLMAGSTLAGAALAAADLSSFPGNLGTVSNGVGQLDAFVVVGDSAKAEDVIGAADIAARLAELQYTQTAVPGTTLSNVNGVEKDTISINNARLASVLPNPVKNIHYNGLKKSTFAWRSNDYDYSEQIELSADGSGASNGVRFAHDFGTDKLNGTEKMYVSSDVVQYQYVFDEAVAGTGSATTLNYTYPIKIKLLGKEFQIVGAGSTSVVMLAGAIGTAIKEGASTTGIATVDGLYTVYVTAASDGNWATFQVKDANGNVVDSSVTVTSEGTTQTASNSGLDIRLTDIRVAGTDPATQHIEADIVVGKSGETQKTYTTSCDVTSTGTSDTKFPGTSDWCIKVASGFAATAGTIGSGDKIIVAYKPSDSPKYFGVGEKLDLPNNYGEVGFSGWNTNTFVTVTAQPTEVTVYNASSTSSSLGSMRAIEFSADVAGTFIDPYTNTGYQKVYLLINKTIKGNTTAVGVGWWDAANSKVLMNIEDDGVNGQGVYYRHLNASYTGGIVDGTNVTVANQYFNFTFNVSYGGSSAVTDQQLLNFNVTGGGNPFTDVRIGASRSGTLALATPVSVDMDFRNKTAWTSTTSYPDFRLGTTDSAEELDITTPQTNLDGTQTASSEVGKANQDVLSDGGVFVVSPGSYSGGQKVLVKVPAETLKVKAYVGKAGGSTTSGSSYNALTPVSSPVAKLASEAGVGSSVRSKNLVLVGGPCANSLVQELVDAGKIPAAYTCAGGLGSGWTSGSAYVWAIDLPADTFTAGKIAIVAAGTDAKDTRLATSVLQQYDASNVKGKLTGTGVKITGTDVSTATITAA